MTAPTLFDATCPTCSGPTEITMAFLKAKSGWMRCRHCQNIFDGFAEDASLRPAKPTASSPMAKVAAKTVKDPAMQDQGASVPDTGHGGSTPSFASAAPARAPRVARFPEAAAEPGAAPIAQGAVAATSALSTAPIPAVKSASGARGARDTDADETSAGDAKEPAARIEVKKRGLVPNREAGAGLGSTAPVAPEAARLLDSTIRFGQAAAGIEPAQEGAAMGGVVPRPETRAQAQDSQRPSAPMATQSLGAAGPPAGRWTQPPGVVPMAAEAPRPAAQVTSLSDQFDRLFLDVDFRFDAPEQADQARGVSDAGQAGAPSSPSRARAPRLAPLSPRDLPELAVTAVTDVDDAIAIELAALAARSRAQRAPLPLVAASVATEQGLASKTVSEPESEPEPAESVPAFESRRLEPRKIAPREIGRAPEVVGRRSEARSWAWGSSAASASSGPTALDRARARLAPPVSWIKKDGPARREILPNWSGWTILAACLAGLCIQAARAERDLIYSRAPWARPQLAALCMVAGCKPGLALANEQLELEAAQVRADADGRLVFTASLRNKASYESLAPRLWLSIEGEDGKSMASRTFSPSEWLGAESVKGASELEAKLVFAAPGKAAAGYKAELVLEAPR